MDARLPCWLVGLLFVCQGLVANGQGRTSVDTTVAAAVTVDGGSDTPASSPRPRETGRRKPADDLPTPMCFPRDFSSTVEKECGDKKHPVKFKNDPPRKSREECEAEVTARELQKAIRHADPNCVAQIVIQSRSVRGIEEGFRIPPEFNFIQNFGFREKDPDIVSIKGLSLGVLQGDTDKNLVPKLVASLVPSFTPRPGEEQEPKKPEQKVKKPAPPTKDHEPSEAGPTVTLCNVTTEEERTDRTFVQTNVTLCKGEGEKKPTRKEKVSHAIDEARFEATLRDRALLRDVFTSDPNEQGMKYEKEGGRRLLISFPKRRLQCSSCMNADSYVCAYCWEEEFCSQFYWCPEV